MRISNSDIFRAADTIRLKEGLALDILDQAKLIDQRSPPCDPAFLRRVVREFIADAKTLADAASAFAAGCHCKDVAPTPPNTPSGA